MYVRIKRLAADDTNEGASPAVTLEPLCTGPLAFNLEETG